MLHGGTWTNGCTGTWVMPYGSNYSPVLLTGMPDSYATAPGPGDQCLRCHNTRTQYNGPRVRDTEDTLFMGHRNMSRKVDQIRSAPNKYAWGGPPFECIDKNTLALQPETTEESCYDANVDNNWVPTIPYPSTDTGQTFDWYNGKIDVGGAKDLYWIYGDWLSALPRAIYSTGFDPVTLKPLMSYSCARCHTTGWTSDSSLQSAKEPEKSFPGITWDGTTLSQTGKVNLAGGVNGDSNKRASWDNFGIVCSRCHNAAIENTGGVCTLNCNTDQATCERATGAVLNPYTPNPGCGGYYFLGNSTCYKDMSLAAPNASYAFAALPSVCSAVGGTLTAGPAFPSAAGLSSHHNNLTVADNSGGVCSDVRYTREFECTGAGATWLTNCSNPSTAERCVQTKLLTAATCLGNGTWVDTADFCSNPFYTSKATCEANGSPANTWQEGWCARTDLTTPTTCVPMATFYVTSLTRTGGTATAVTNQDHPFVPGDFITIAGVDSANKAEWNKDFLIVSVPTFSSFTFALAGSTPGTSTANITANPSRAWRTNGSQASCEIGGGTFALSKCSVEGVCNKGASYTTASACTTAGGQFKWATDVIRCEDIAEYGEKYGIPAYAAAEWTGSYTQRGGLITGLCMNCHRQETKGVPYDNATTGAAGANPAAAEAAAEPGKYLKIGPYHGTVGFISHYHGNQFLNSPHARFTGKFNQIGIGKNDAVGGTQQYKSWFIEEGEAQKTGNGCTGCHDVHQSTVTGEEPFRAECTECHSGSYAKDLDLIAHPSGVGTPLEEKDTKPSEACITCHMPEGLHLWRVNTAETYETFPAAAMAGNMNAPTQDDGEGMTNAVWLDVDLTCGQCHGGGKAHAEDLGGGSIAATDKILTVTDASLFTVGERIRIVGAGALYYDETGTSKYNDDFDTRIQQINLPNQLLLAGAATKTVSGADVIQNPNRENVSYKTKTQLAFLAAGIHSGTPLPASNITFMTQLQNPNTLVVDVNGLASTCSGSSSNCDLYEWDCDNNGTYDLTGATATCVYVTAGTKWIRLRVTDYGVSGGTALRSVTTYKPDYPPVAAGNPCSTASGGILDPVNINQWKVQVTDASTDDNAVKQVTVTWGDGTILASDITLPFGPFNHTYAKVGTFNLQHKAIDTKGQSNIRTCSVTIGYFSIGGTVFRSNGSTPVASATVKIYKGTTLIKTVYTNGSGVFSATGLKPGTYNVTVTKTSYNFGAAPQRTGIVVGPNNVVSSILAVSP
jgi:hypothetical protein